MRKLHLDGHNKFKSICGSITFESGACHTAILKTGKNTYFLECLTSISNKNLYEGKCGDYWVCVLINGKVAELMYTPYTLPF